MTARKENFLQAILYLMTSQIIIKMLGMIYSLYLTNKTGFGDEGNAICMSGFQIYALTLGICAIGVPNSVSKMVSERAEIGDIENCNKILKISLLLFSSIGFIFCIVLYTFSNFIAKNILSIESSANIIKILSPSIVFSTIESVYRGYFNGIRKISISAKSTVIEQCFKTVLTIILVETAAKITNYNTEIMAEIAMLAASIATITSFIYSYIKYKKTKFDFCKREDTDKDFKYYSLKNILKELLSLMLPISLTTAILILQNNIDSITIVRILKNKIGDNEARKAYGIITSKVNLLIGLPSALNGAVSISLIPEISRNAIKKDTYRLKRNIVFSVLLTLIISIPMMLIFIMFSNRIMLLLYPNAPKGAELLKLAAVSIIFTCLTQNISGILQGIGDSKTHLCAVVLGMILKTILNIKLISNNSLLEKGAIISSIASNILIFIIMAKKMYKDFKFMYTKL